MKIVSMLTLLFVTLNAAAIIPGQGQSGKTYYWVNDSGTSCLASRNAATNAKLSNRRDFSKTTKAKCDEINKNSNSGSQSSEATTQLVCRPEASQVQIAEMKITCNVKGTKCDLIRKNKDEKNPQVLSLQILSVGYGQVTFGQNETKVVMTTTAPHSATVFSNEGLIGECLQK